MSYSNGSTDTEAYKGSYSSYALEYGGAFSGDVLPAPEPTVYDFDQNDFNSGDFA